MEKYTRNNLQDYEVKLFIENSNALVLLANLLDSLDDFTLKAKMLNFAKQYPLKIQNLDTCIQYFNFAIESEKGSEEFKKHKNLLDIILKELYSLLGEDAIESFRTRISLLLDNYMLDEILFELDGVRKKSSNIIQFKKRKN